MASSAVVSSLSEGVIEGSKRFVLSDQVPLRFVGRHDFLSKPNYVSRKQVELSFKQGSLSLVFKGVSPGEIYYSDGSIKRAVKGQPYLLSHGDSFNLLPPNAERSYKFLVEIEGDVTSGGGDDTGGDSEHGPLKLRLELSDVSTSTLKRARPSDTLSSSSPTKKQKLSGGAPSSATTTTATTNGRSKSVAFDLPSPSPSPSLTLSKSKSIIPASQRGRLSLFLPLLCDNKGFDAAYIASVAHRMSLEFLSKHTTYSVTLFASDRSETVDSLQRLSQREPSTRLRIISDQKVADAVYPLSRLRAPSCFYCNETSWRLKAGRGLCRKLFEVAGSNFAYSTSQIHGVGEVGEVYSVPVPTESELFDEGVYTVLHVVSPNLDERRGDVEESEEKAKELLTQCYEKVFKEFVAQVSRSAL